MLEAVGTLAFYTLRLRGSYQLLIPMLSGDSGGCGVSDWPTASTQISASEASVDERLAGGEPDVALGPR